MTDVSVVGLGKIGLPLACAVARGGHRVHGVDIDPRVVDDVNAGIEPFPGEHGLAEALQETSSSGALTATADAAAAVSVSSVVIVVVPLVVDADARPDFGAMDAATAAVAAAVRPGTLIVYETTLPVGTTRNRFAPALRAGSSLRAEDDLFVAHSPERVFSGRIFADLRRYPKLVGGIDAASGERAALFYRSFLDFDDRPELPRPNGVWDLGSAEAAEFAKLAETTYRDLNIAFANELAVASESIGVDVYEVIEACNTQPFSHIHQPGVSVGGHCIPVYPHFLLGSVDHVHLPALARRTNDGMPALVVERVASELGDLAGRRVAVLGLSYRDGVKEHAFSGTFALVAEIERRGGVAWVDDPLYEPEEISRLGLRPYERGAAVDAAVLHTAHAEYGKLTSADLPGVEVVVDGRRFFDPSRWADIRLFVLGAG